MLWRGQGPSVPGMPVQRVSVEMPIAAAGSGSRAEEGGGWVLLHGRGDHLLLGLHGVLVGVLVLFGPAPRGTSATLNSIPRPASPKPPLVS